MSRTLQRSPFCFVVYQCLSTLQEYWSKYTLGGAYLVYRRGGNRSSGVYRGGQKGLQFTTAIGAAK